MVLILATLLFFCFVKIVYETIVLFIHLYNINIRNKF